MSKNFNEMDIILKAELCHILGADRLSQEEIKGLKKNEVDDFFKELISALNMFYMLENEKHRVKIKTGIQKPPNDAMIDRRLKFYEGTFYRFNLAGLSLLHSSLLIDEDPVYEASGKKTPELEAAMESIEDFIIYICYRKTVGIISDIKYITTDNKDKCATALQEELEAQNNMKDLLRFFGQTAHQRLGTEGLRRDIDAKLRRFEGKDRCAYWRSRFDQAAKDQKCKYYEPINDPVEACFFSPIEKMDFMGKFLILLLLKYHVKSHKISEGKQYSIFHKIKTKNGKEDYSLLASYISYKNELERCRKVFTFVRFVSKYFPEFFIPLGGRCISDLLQAVAYLRRGNTYYLQENTSKAFNDYNFSQNFLRQKTECEKKPLGNRVELYSAILEAVSLGVKGECYRQDYDYDNAYDYFCQSVTLFEDLPKRFQKLKPADKDDRWHPNESQWKDMIDFGLRFNLNIINKAKMFMVKGDFRRAIKWYSKCLRNFFNLYKRIKDIKSTPRKEIIGHRDLIDAFEDTIFYLEQTKNNAIIHKASLTEYLSKLTDRLQYFLDENSQDMKNECRLTGLISDIYNRISMLLYLLSIPGKLHPDCHELSRRWHQFALDFNSFNGLARYNQLIYSNLGNASGASSSNLDDFQNLNFFDLTHDGSLFNRYNRHFATWTLLNIAKEKTNISRDDSINSAYRQIANNLISRMFQYTDNFSQKNKELFKYLTRERTITRDRDGITKIVVLRRWSSFTPAIPRPSAFHNRGGGFFIVHEGKGIAVDPGFDFVLNLYQEGYSVNDIDAVLITHDHIDHHSNFDTLLTLWHLNKNDMGVESEVKEIYLSAGLAARYNFLLNKSKDYRVYPLKEGSTVKPVNADHAYEIDVKKAIHRDLSTQDYSVGFVLRLKRDNVEGFRIGFTGDTRYDKNIMKGYIDCDVLLFNISSIPFREMRYFFGKTELAEDDEYKDKLKSVLTTFVGDEHRRTDLPLIANQLYYAYWYMGAGKNAIECLFTDVDTNPDNAYAKMKLGDHLYLKGILEFNEMMKAKCSVAKDKPRLVIITELKEEIGSFRNKIAEEINRYNNHPPNLKYLTGDIGMTVCLLPRNITKEPLRSIQVCCTRCKLNNDYLQHDKFHPIDQISDFCIKGEDEGLFYLCNRHDIPNPDRPLDTENPNEGDEVFFQKIERYNVFGKA